MMAKVVYLNPEKKTMEYKAMLWAVGDIIGIPMSVWGFILNIDNVKSAIIALLVIVYLMVRLYFYVVQKKQAVREKEYDLWFREMSKQEHQRKIKRDNSI